MTDVAGVISGASTTTPGSHRRVSIFDIFEDNEEFTKTMMKPLTVQQREVLRMLSMVPSSFNMEYMDFCFANTYDKGENATNANRPVGAAHQATSNKRSESLRKNCCAP